MSGITGLEVLFSAIKNDLKSKEDCAVAAIHWLLIRSDLLCVGVGELFSDNDAGKVTELLPDNWNESQDAYCLRYCCKDLKNRYLLKIVKTGCNLHVDFAMNEDTVTATTIATNDFVSDDFNNFSQTYKKLNELKSQVKKDILKNIVDAKKKSIASPDKETKKKASPKNEPNKESPQARIPENRPIPVGIPDSRHPMPFAYPQIGASDLDPLGRGVGGMLFDPFGPGAPARPGFGGSRGGRFGSGNTGLPPGAVPPGARFDPFSPVYPDRFNPNPDHFRPPDYDNMFM